MLPEGVLTLAGPLLKFVIPGSCVASLEVVGLVFQLVAQ